jgi:gamma-glutamyltranspeptidase/glutathione hydrolase
MRHLFVVLLIFSSLLSCKQEERDPAVLNRGMVVSAHPLASEVGAAILETGGNAFDAAVATNFALAVVYPRAGNLGGGGFATFRLSNGGYGTLDFRERAPKAASRDMYLDSLGEVVPNLSKVGALSIGVPGTVEGMVQLHKKYGKLSWRDVIAPAIELAVNGHALSPYNAEMIFRYREDFFEVNEDTILYTAQQWLPGDLIFQPKLAATLKLIAAEGRDGFYKGVTAKYMTETVNDRGGILSLRDLKSYEAVWRESVRDSIGDYTIISIGPPSSGGLAILQLLKSYKLLKPEEFEPNSSEYIHFIAELEKRVFADRAVYLGDPDFVQVPIEQLLSKEYLEERMKEINLEQNTPSSEMSGAQVEVIESHETTHLSVVDQEGNCISLTTTLNSNFGSKLFIQEAGFFMNNEMDDFSAKPGVPNQFGLIGAEANAIEPKKRMLSSMSPTIVLKKGKPHFVLGSPGGSTIITNVFQNILNLTEHGMKAEDAVNAPRFHHQWLPDVVYLEYRMADSTLISELSLMGHEVEIWDGIGLQEAIFIDDSMRVFGLHDYTRGEGAAVGTSE